MKRKEKLIIVLGYVLVFYAVFGILISIIYYFCRPSNSDAYFKKAALGTFSYSFDGGSSNLPIFFGLCAIAGAILLTLPKNRNEQKLSN